MIALNEPLDGNLEGVRGADLECYRQARQAGYKVGLFLLGVLNFIFRPLSVRSYHRVYKT